MLSLEEMLIRFVIALILGAIIGFERELLHKEAGVRTTMLVSAGSAIFAMIGLMLPHIISAQTGNLSEVVARNGGFLSVIANVVVGIGFLGAGVIIKHENRVHGLTTAALVWMTAGIGLLVGLGVTYFAVISAVIVSLLLYFLKGVGFGGSSDPRS